MTRRCRHGHKYAFNIYRGRVMTRECGDCNAQLPLGPSNDAPDAVRVEIRAAELAASAAHMWRLVSTGISEQDDEVAGYLTSFSPTRAPRNAQQQAGYLASCIATHDNEATQRRVR